MMVSRNKSRRSCGLALRRNLARVDEVRIDYDLVEALLSYLHEAATEGAVLVFLPGTTLMIWPHKAIGVPETTPVLVCYVDPSDKTHVMHSIACFHHIRHCSCCAHRSSCT